MLQQRYNCIVLPCVRTHPFVYENSNCINSYLVKPYLPYRQLSVVITLILVNIEVPKVRQIEIH
jgi:hypothetical protein